MSDNIDFLLTYLDTNSLNNITINKNRDIDIESLYFILLFFLEKDTRIAKAIEPFNKNKRRTLERNLSSFVFKKQNVAEKFKDSALQTLETILTLKLQTVKLMIVAGNNTSILLLEALAKTFATYGVNVRAPQLLFDKDTPLYFDCFSNEMHLADIILKLDIDEKDFERISKNSKANYEIVNYKNIEETLIIARKIASKKYFDLR